MKTSNLNKKTDRITVSHFQFSTKNHLAYGIRTGKYRNLFCKIPLGINPLTRVILAITQTRDPFVVFGHVT